MLWVGILQQFCKLQGVFANFLHWSQEEAIQRDVDHLLKQATCFEEINILAHFGESGKLHAGIGVIIAVLRIDLELVLLNWKQKIYLIITTNATSSSTFIILTVYLSFMGVIQNNKIQQVLPPSSHGKTDSYKRNRKKLYSGTLG